jgi:hypothetical protein
MTEMHSAEHARQIVICQQRRVTGSGQKGEGSYRYGYSSITGM